MGDLRLANGESTIAAATAFEQSYRHQYVAPTFETAKALHDRMIAVKEAANEIASTYESLEALNTSSAQEIQQLLAAVPPPGQSGSGGVPPGTGVLPTQPS